MRFDMLSGKMVEADEEAEEEASNLGLLVEKPRKLLFEIESGMAILAWRLWLGNWDVLLLILSSKYGLTDRLEEILKVVEAMIGVEREQRKWSETFSFLFPSHLTLQSLSSPLKSFRAFFYFLPSPVNQPLPQVSTALADLFLTVLSLSLSHTQDLRRKPLDACLGACHVKTTL